MARRDIIARWRWLMVFSAMPTGEEERAAFVVRCETILLDGEEQTNLTGLV